MAKVIVNATHKGGEGKTTNSIMLAEYFAHIEGKKVLLIDLDTQANLSGRYIKMDYDPHNSKGKIPPLHPSYSPEEDKESDGRSSIGDIFFGKPVYPYPTQHENLDLLPSHSELLQRAEAVTYSDIISKIHDIFCGFLSGEDVQQSYDLIIIDTPPSIGPLTTASIKAATHIIIPAQMEQFSIDGIYGMLQLWKQEKFRRPQDKPLELLGILPNQVRHINLHKQFLESLQKTEGVSDYIMPYAIMKRVIYTELLVEGANPKSLFELSENHEARQEYESVCKYISGRVFNHG